MNTLKQLFLNLFLKLYDMEICSRHNRPFFLWLSNFVKGLYIFHELIYLTILC